MKTKETGPLENSAGNAADNDAGHRVHGNSIITGLITCQDLSSNAQRGTVPGMSRDHVNSICRGLPGAEWSDPWGGGHDAWKIGGKMFACIGVKNDGVSVKTPDIETAQMLIDSGVGVKAPYFHLSWVRLPFDADSAEMRHRLAASYDLVRASLTKKAQAELPPRS